MGFFDQMKQLGELKSKMDEVKKRLDTIEVSIENEYVKVTATGNRKVKEVQVYKTEDRLLLERHLQAAINEVLEKSDNVMQSEMMGVTKGMMPDGLPGM